MSITALYSIYYLWFVWPQRVLSCWFPYFFPSYCCREVAGVSAISDQHWKWQVNFAQLLPVSVPLCSDTPIQSHSVAAWLSQMNEHAQNESRMHLLLQISSSHHYFSCVTQNFRKKVFFFFNRTAHFEANLCLQTNGQNVSFGTPRCTYLSISPLWWIYLRAGGEEREGGEKKG